MKSVQIRSFFWSVFCPNTGKYGPEKTPSLDTFHAVNGEEREMFLRNENTLVRVGDSTNGLINALFRDLFAKYQENMIEKIKGSDYIFEYVDRLYYGCHKITLNGGENNPKESYTSSVNKHTPSGF